ncbi:FmdE family protein [Methanonatronarchaeum thermophilum]|nr:FmdE family protein [Methanonatronarchaeum thermophilum]
MKIKQDQWKKTEPKTLDIQVKPNENKKPKIGNKIVISTKNTSNQTKLTMGTVIEINNDSFKIKTEEEIEENTELQYKITNNTPSIANPREKINNYIENNDLTNLVLEAGKLHGHICPMVVLGVKVGVDGLKQLEIDHQGMEDIIVLIETNSCFSDGIQLSTGCTFGNNALIYRDYGKTAATIIKRNEIAIRYNYKAYNYIEEEYPETHKLFEKVVKKREGTEKQQKQLQEKWRKIALEQLNKPIEELFKIEKTENTSHLNLPKKAPIFEDKYCNKCEEKIMAPKTTQKNGKTQCIPCSNTNYLQLDGSGLKEINK